MKRILSLILAALVTTTVALADDYKNSREYLALRDSMHHAFNDGDSARFFVALANLEGYLLKQNDLHAYYTQRCNEIVFQLNRGRVFEAYKLATELSKELTNKKLDKEMYMAVNMMGHIYRYCGNKQSAKRCFWEVIRRMEQEGYTESQPPIYMNLVNIIMDENPDEALRLIDQALSIAREASPERVFDIETRRTLAYYMMGDTQRFLDGYKAYRDSVAVGQSSVHGRKLEIYYLAHLGRIDEAVALAKESSDDPYETQAELFANAGRWEEAYQALKRGAAESDSINSIILSGSMQGIQDELEVYEMERHTARLWLYGMIAITVLLLMLVVALIYIVQSRRRHLKEMQEAYQRVVESEQMKTEFIKNVSHEVRTPLNIISGFAQVLANPGYGVSSQERQHIAETMIHNTHLITTMVNEILEISRGDNYDAEVELTELRCNETLKRLIDDFCKESGSDRERIDFKTELNDDFTIMSHEDMLKSVFWPLFDNAVKYAPEGRIGIKVSTRMSFDDQNMEFSTPSSKLLVTVEDNGTEIPVGEAEHIFEHFVKLDTFKEGMGLGLTFSRTMARRMGGDVRLDTSFEGKGARFEVILKL